MKNKGYTLIEILIVITIGVIITTIAATSFITIRNKQKEINYNNMVENIKIASELYLKNDNNFKKVLVIGRMINLPINVLLDVGYLEQYYQTNPINNKSIKDNCIIIMLGDENEYKYGDLVECNGFLVFETNPIIFYNSIVSKTELLEGVTAYDNELNELDKELVVIKDSDIDDLKFGENILKYYLNDISYDRNVRIIDINNINNYDTEKPVITFSGKNPLLLGLGDITFHPTKRGAVKAIDNVDGDITNKIKVIHNDLNPLKPGKYSITYKVTDSAGNTTIATREVEVRYWWDL